MTTEILPKPTGEQILDAPDQIRGARLLILRGRFRLELVGIRFKGRTTYSIVKHEFGLKGNRQSVYTQFCELVAKETGV